MFVEFAPFPFHLKKPAVVNWAMDTWEGIVLRVGGVHARLETRQAVHLMGNSSAHRAVADAPAGNGNLMLHLHLILARCERANPTCAYPISMSNWQVSSQPMFALTLTGMSFIFLIITAATPKSDTEVF